jgi:hypothetical protein
LFEYATSIYPLAISELRVADWYSSQIVAVTRSATKKVGYQPFEFGAGDAGVQLSAEAAARGEDFTASLEKLENARAIVVQRLENADIDIQRIEKFPNEQVQLPSIMQRKAIIVGRMQQVGDNSFGDAEDLFKQALALFAASSVPQSDGYARYYYAQFLNDAYGGLRRADINTLLSPLYTSDIYAGEPVEYFLKNEKENRLNVKAGLTELATMDQGFKSYLISLGWKESDF